MSHGKCCTVSNCHVTKTMSLQRFGGVRDLFKTIFFAGMFFNFFLEGRKPKRAQITVMKSIFKPIINIVRSFA